MHEAAEELPQAPQQRGTQPEKCINKVFRHQRVEGLQAMSLSSTLDLQLLVTAAVRSTLAVKHLI